MIDSTRELERPSFGVSCRNWMLWARAEELAPKSSSASATAAGIQRRRSLPARDDVSGWGRTRPIEGTLGRKSERPRSLLSVGTGARDVYTARDAPTGVPTSPTRSSALSAAPHPRPSMFVPEIVSTLRGYTRRQLLADLQAGKIG